MPFINISVSQPVSAEKKNELQLEIGGAVSVIPGKNVDNTTINIADAAAMFRSGKPFSGAFVDVRLFNASPLESKREFSKKLFEIFSRVLDIPEGCLQINFIELPSWGANGNLMT